MTTWDKKVIGFILGVALGPPIFILLAAIVVHFIQ